MVFLEYVNLALKTESKFRPLSLDVVDLGLTDRIAHAFIGLAGELDEYNLAMEKYDRINGLEELGDMLWFLAVLKDEVDFPLDRIDTRGLRLSLDGLDMIKKTMFYGKVLNIGDVKTEANKVYNLVLAAIEKNNGSAEQVMVTNINKLKARFGDKFTSDGALNRDLDKERETLEEGLK